MNRSNHTCSGAMLSFAVVLAITLGSPATAAARSIPTPDRTPIAQSADLAPDIGADGVFRGTPGVTGTVDANAWTLVSNLATGEPPRFAPATNAPNVVSTVTGPWSPLGSNGSGDGALNSNVNALAVSGSNLYVGGDFTNAAGIATADYVAVWNGNAWSALGSNTTGGGAINNSVFALAVSGNNLYAGGNFSNAAGVATADYVAEWNGSTWSGLGSNGLGDGAINKVVFTLAVSGSHLYVGGAFGNVAGVSTADYLAEWDGTTWSGLGSNGAGDGALNYPVLALAVSGSNLYVGGYFTNAAGIATADYVALWHTTVLGGGRHNFIWSALGSNGAGDGALNQEVRALAVSGSNLYVGGAFTNAAGMLTADNIAEWNGSAWSALGSNGAGDGAIDDSVDALAVSGSDLYVSGLFSDAAGIATADLVAEWNGSAWSALGSNGSGDGAIQGLADALVDALAVSGSNLYVGGYFTNAAGIHEADYVALWSPGSTVVRKPDARIRLGTAAYAGNNIYNTTGANQTRKGSATKGHSVTFGISIQNDGSGGPDSFVVSDAGAASTGYTVNYFHGTTDITAAVTSGTYETWSLAPGATFLITATVKVGASAPKGSNVSRLVTIRSVGDGSRQDTVKFVAKRAK